MFGALGDVVSFQAVDAVGSVEQPEAGALSIDDVESNEGVAGPAEPNADLCGAW
jgi:hypothetical protein